MKLFVLSIFSACLLSETKYHVKAANPSYLMMSRQFGRPSATRTLQGRLQRQLMLNSNTLLSKGLAVSSTKRHMVLDFFDPLEPFEMLWEFYCNRYEIAESLMGKFLVFSRRNTVRALVVMGAALVVGEVLARVGVIGDRGEGLVDYVKESERFNEGTRERAFQKTSSFMVDKGMRVLRGFRRFGGKSKFAISVGAGTLFGQFAIQSTVFCVRATLISFFVLETMSFLGIIGEMGESILDWVEDEQDRHAGWTKRFAQMHKNFRRKLSFEWLEELYEAAIDEEKIASFGFSVGTVIALIT